MVDLLFCLYYLCLLLLDFPLLCYYINLRSSIILCLFFGEIHLSLGISLSGQIFFASIVTASELFFSDVIQTFGDFISNFIANQINSCFCYFFLFFIFPFEAVLSVSVVACLAWSRHFLLYLRFIFLLIF